jgi:hypothetical protein
MWNLKYEKEPEKQITSFIISVASPSKVNYFYCDKPKIDFYTEWFKKAYTCYVKKYTFPWRLFESEVGIYQATGSAYKQVNKKTYYL